MVNPDNNQLQKKVDLLWNVTSSLLQSANLFRWVGYGLLILASFDLVDIFVPLNFTNPIWEFATLGKLVEQAAVPLIGVVLVFVGERDGRQKWELVILKYLSWSMLLAGFLFLLLIPLGVVNTVRINNANNAGITDRANQEISQVKQVRQQLEAVTTVDQLKSLLSRFEPQGRAPEIDGIDQLATVKQQFDKSLTENEKRINEQANATRLTQRLTLLKNSVKWNLGALISSGLFVYLWRGTAWTRSRG
jgi:hypothetical protein